MRLSAFFLERIKQEEGFREWSYWDDAPGGGGGQWTWGYGTRAPGPNQRTTRENATTELEVEIAEAESDFRAVFPVDPPGLTQARYEAIVDLLFNIGLTRFAGPDGFRNTITAMREGNWVRAAAHLQSSLWYKQVGNRAKRIVREVHTGVRDGESAPATGTPHDSVLVGEGKQDGKGFVSVLGDVIGFIMRVVRRKRA